MMKTPVHGEVLQGERTKYASPDALSNLSGLICPLVQDFILIRAEYMLKLL